MSLATRRKMRRGREYNGREKRRESEGIGKKWRAGRKGGEAHNCEASNALGKPVNWKKSFQITRKSDKRHQKSIWDLEPAT